MGDVPSLLKHKCIIWMDKNVTYIIICSHSCLCKIVWSLPVEHKRGISEEYPDRTALNHIIWGRQAPKWQKAQPFTATSCHFETKWHQFSFTFIILATLLRILLRNSPLFHRRQSHTGLERHAGEEMMTENTFWFFKAICQHTLCNSTLLIFQVITRYNGSRVWIKSEKDIYRPHCTGRCHTFI